MNSLWSVTLKWILGIRNLINNGQQWMAGIQTPVTISHDYSPTLSGSGGRGGISWYQGDLGEGKVSIEDVRRCEKGWEGKMLQLERTKVSSCRRRYWVCIFSILFSTHFLKARRRRIRLAIKSFWWSFPLFLWPLCLIQGGIERRN